MATELSAAIVSLVKEAFGYGFDSPATYNDTVQNSAEEAWAKHEAALTKAAAALAAPPVEQQAAPVAEPVQPSREFLVPDPVWEALQRMIEDGVRRGPASREDAKAVADWRGRFWKKAEPEQPAPQAGAAEKLAKELIRLAGILRDCGRLVNPSGTAERTLLDAADLLDAAHPTEQPSQDATEEFVGYLCCAWGESDRPVAELVRDLESVGLFMVRQWLGADDAQDYDGTPTLPRLMTEWHDHDWDNEWSADFEIGGVSVERLHCTIPAARAAQAQGEKGEQG